MLDRDSQNNIKVWQSDPLSKAIYENATNPNRTDADNVKLRALEEQRKQRDYKSIQVSQPVEPELTQFEKDCTRVMKFTQLLKKR